MPDEPRHQMEPMHRPPAGSASRSGGGTRVQIELKGPLGCLAGSVILILVLAILAVAALAGFIALTLAAWFAAGFLAIAIIAALLRGRDRR